MAAQVPQHQKIVDVGTTVAFYTPEHAWVIGNVTAYDVKGKVYTCSSKDPQVTMDKIVNAPDRMWTPSVELLEEDKNDLLLLTELHEASLMFCLKKRYMRNVVYTNIGPIVVALNPFNYNIPWYLEDQMGAYLSEGVVIERNLPHSWAVAHNTYWEMRENKQHQTVLISGESGAGKTEAAKIVARYLGAVSTLNGTDDQKEAMKTVNRKILASSPILESFGNAKTVRNDNSSRFGKFAKLQFDSDGFLVGCFVTKYLLEKSRIITAAQNERVYHSFYQLAQGDAAKKFGIRNAKIFRTLNSGGCITITNERGEVVEDDAKNFLETQQAMIDVGISEEERNSIFRVVAGILYLQNLEFVEVEERSGKVAKIDTNMQAAAARACELWEINEERLVAELTSNTITARNEITVKLLNRAQAQDTRDTASKSIYDWLFNWLVEKINRTTDVESRCTHWIGLLDIFGFEDFKLNSFEQLCINLANENLQNHYNWHIFTEDMRECKEEGIDTTAVQFVDNKGCLDLLMGKTGIFALLDEECARSGNEKNFLAVLNERFAGSKSGPKTGDPYYAQSLGKAMDNCFQIKHYAAEVQYCVDGFLDKNRDTLKEATKRLLKDSTLPFLSALVPPLEDPNARPAAKITVSGYFIRQLHDLMSVIRSTNPHWIRCIKPHPNKLPLNFSNKMVMAQLRSAGVLDTVRVRKAGYPIRFPNGLFLTRYRILVIRAGNETDRQLIEAMFQRFKIGKDIGQLGKSKVFLRQDAFSRLNHAKDEATLSHALVVQAVGRASKERAALFTSYVQVHRARILEEKQRKEEALKRKREEEERRRRAEEEERERQERLMRQAKYIAAVTIQRHVRGLLARRSVVRYFLEQSRAHDEAQCDSELQKLRSQFINVDKRVKVLEDKYFERAKMTAQINANENYNSDMAKRRQHLIEVRNKLHQRQEEQRKAQELQRERDLAADKNRKKETFDDVQSKKVEAEQRAAERRRQQKAAREANEEKLVAEMQRQHELQARLKATATARREETEAQYRTHHRRQFPQDDTTLERAFQTARDDFVKNEWWETTREQRFEEITIERQRVQRRAIAAPSDPTAPNILHQSQTARLALSPVERRLEELYRERAVAEAISRAADNEIISYRRV